MAWEDRAYYREGPPGHGSRMAVPIPTRLTFVVIGLCLVVFLVQAATAPIAALSPIVKWGRLVFSDYLAFTQPWRWITYQYIHQDGGHVFFNCLALYFFMPTLERLWGWRR